MIAVLLPPTLGRPTRLPGLGGALAPAGITPVRIEVGGDELPPHAARYVAAASLEIRRLVPPDAPTALVAEGDAGPLAGALGAAQRAAHRPVFGYVLVDALLPQPGTATRADLDRTQNPRDAAPPPAPAGEPEGYRTETLPPSADWPDAPCGYLLTDPARAHAARLARMRGWQVRECAPEEAAAELAALLRDLRGTA
ncbi:hypothetical protein ACOQFV_03225 [Nocardiopsis changdeensis]|uniref:Alpha/beta hydrolase n=1 Tax=Nocardiopsis changdeensis TaxID=2831969 RepID=A0ABX8BKK8_9ACTN|nr:MULTISPECIES: hypothetical protein [Nocardiopsis]QUX22631.1 hypothetical protein KGD84_30795 [Nocardiopsis changdeensis]QYX38574.1 hypothetical protein K1J57_08175 [Nocardiopsis sp. MT53]